MKKIFKKITALLLAVSVIGAMPVMTYAANGEYLSNIMFDEAVTNDASDFVDVAGTVNARVVEDGTRNKSFGVDVGYVDNDINVFVPSYTPQTEYVVQFDMRIEGAPVSGSIDFVSSSGITVQMLSIDTKSKLRAADDSREVGTLNSESFKTVTVMFNTDLKYYTVLMNGRERIYRRSMNQMPENIETLVIKTNAAGSQSTMYFDNIRVYGGTKYINKKADCTYNEYSIDWEPVDESKAGNEIYYKNAFDTPSSFSMANNQKTNKIGYTAEEENGFVKIEKTTTSDSYFDITVPKTAKRVVLEGDFRYNKEHPETLFILRDSASSSTQITAGIFTVKTGAVVAGGASSALKKNEWNRISLVMDFVDYKYNIYVNNKRVIANKDFTSELKIISILRVYVNAGTAFGTIDVDNISIYAGTEPRDIAAEQIAMESMFSGEDTGLKFLKGKRAVQTYSNTIFASNEKSKLTNECINYGDESLLPEEAFEKLFGKNVAVAGNAITVEGGVSMAVGSDKMNVSGIEHTIPYPPEQHDGVTYIPANAYGELVCEKGTFLNDDHGMLISASGLGETDMRYKPANQYMFFERKSAEELKEQFMGRTDNAAKHPRLMLNDEIVKRLQQEVKTDPYKKKWFEAVKKTADGILNQSVNEYKISNGRLLDVANSTLNRMEYLGFVYQITKDKKYAERGIAEMMAVCAFEDWHPTHYLDTGTLASGVALGFDWFYHEMTEEQREFIATNAQKHAVQTAKMAYHNASDNWWAKTETNWGVIVNGGIANLILSTAEYNTDDCMGVLRDALQAIECTWYRFAPDGAWYEGSGYWGYLLRHLDIFMDSYGTVMGETFGRDYRGLSNYGYFQAYFQGPDGLMNNFHDADLGNRQSSGQFYLAKEYNDNELMLYRRDQMEKYNVAPEIYDILWYDASLSGIQGQINLDKDKYFRETEFVAMREKWGESDSAWLSFHGGPSNNAHDHVDVGTFIYNIGGPRWAIDLGKEPLSYTPANPAIAAGYDGWFYYRRKAEGHNVVIINPDDGYGMDIFAFAQVYEPVSGENGAYSRIDLSTAYAANATNYIRGYMLSDSRRTLTVRDEISLSAESELRWFMHTEGQIRIVDNNTAIIYQDGKALKLQFLTNAANATLTAMEAESLPQSPKFQMTPNIGVTKLDYQLHASGDVTITVKMSLIDEVGSETGVDNTPIAKWDVNNISAGRAYKYCDKRADDIKINGETVNKFDKNKFNYSYTKDKNGALPEVTATGDGTVNVEYYKKFDNTDVALVTVSDASGQSTYYTVEFEEYTEKNLDIYNSLPLTAIDVSSEQIEEEVGTYNVKENSTDGDLTTRWSANGTKEWCVYDLGSSMELDAFAVALWMGNQRQFMFDILVSEDNIVYEKVMSVVTIGDTEDPVVYLPEKTVKGRYIKYAGFGSNTNEWNNVIEFMALKKK